MTREKVKMKLLGADGNAFAIMGRFQSAARRQGWKQEEISEVLTEAKSSDYNHLLATIMDYVEEPFGSDENENPFDDDGGSDEDENPFDDDGKD